MVDDLILVTNWEKVEGDDFYLSDGWAGNVDSETLKLAKELQMGGGLYVGYVISAKSYAIYRQMDAHEIYIDEDGNEIISCESTIIENNFQHVKEYSY